jgi:hypothetical protein
MNDPASDPKTLWKEQAMTTTTISLDQVMKAQAIRANRQIKWRNGREYAACLLVLCGFAFYIVEFPQPIMRAGSVLIILATLFVAWQLRQRASARALPGAYAGESWIDFRRAQLTRQRDALRSAWLWYVAPFVPGVVVFRWGVAKELAQGPFAQGWTPNLCVAAIFVGIAILNRYAARKLQRRIDELVAQAD